MIELDFAHIKANDSIVAFFNDEFTTKLPRDMDICPKLPLWRDFDPLKYPRFLPNIALLKIDLNDFSDSEYTLAGETLQDIIDIRLKGIRLNQLTSHTKHEKIIAVLKEAISSKENKCHTLNLPFEGREHVVVNRGVFPFCDNEGLVTNIVIVIEIIDNT